MRQEKLKDALEIIQDYFIVDNRLNMTEMLDWHKALGNDGGERSWWLEPALMTVFWELGVVDSGETTDAQMFPIGHKMRKFRNVSIWNQIRKDTLIAADGAMSYGTGSVYDKVYVFLDGGGWKGPAKIPQHQMSEWPQELWEFRSEIDVAYLSHGLWAWYPAAALSNLDRIAHAKGFYPTTDLADANQKDISVIIQKVRSVGIE